MFLIKFSTYVEVGIVLAAHTSVIRKGDWQIALVPSIHPFWHEEGKKEEGRGKAASASLPFVLSPYRAHNDHLHFHRTMITI